MAGSTDSGIVSLIPLPAASVCPFPLYSFSLATISPPRFRAPLWPWDCFPIIRSASLLCSYFTDMCVAYCCPCVVYGTLRSTFTQKPDDCVQDGAIFCVSAMCCLAPALGAINRYEMREKYNIIGLHQSETAGVKKHFEGKTSNELLGKKDGHGFITVYFPATLIFEGDLLFPSPCCLGLFFRCQCCQWIPVGYWEGFHYVFFASILSNVF